MSSLFQSAGFRKYFSSTSWLMGERVLRMGVSFIIGVYVVRYLGPERYGVLSYAMSFVALFLSIASLGVDEIVVRDLSKDTSEKPVVLGTAFYLKIVGTFLMGGTIAIVTEFSGETVLSKEIILILIVPVLLQSFNIIELFFRATVQSQYVAYANIMALVTASAAKMFFIFAQLSLIGFAWIYSLEAFVFSLGLIFCYQWNVGKISSWKWDKEYAKKILKDGWPMILAGLSTGLYMKMDQVMIMKLLDSSSVGLYSTAVKLCEVWLFVSMVICPSVLPAIVNAKAKDQNLYRQRMIQLYRLMLLISISISIGTTLSSEFLISFLFGEEFLESSPVLALYIWSLIPLFLAVASSQALTAENLLKYSFYRTILGSISNLLLNLWFIPLYGIMGAVYATLISYSIATLALFVFKETNPIGMTMLASFIPQKRVQ